MAGHELATSRVRVLLPFDSVENHSVCKLPSLLCALSETYCYSNQSTDVINDESCVAWWSVSVWQAASCHVIVAVDTSPVRTNIVHGATSFLPSPLPSIPFSMGVEDKLRHKKQVQSVERVCCHLLGRERCLFIGPGVSSYICPAGKCLRSRAFQCVLV